VGEFVVGVPLITPVLLSKVRPAGSAGVMDQLLIAFVFTTLLPGVTGYAGMPVVYWRVELP
jgi:hypothetical protein